MDISRYINDINLATAPIITFNGVVIPYEASVRSLGVIIDNQLNWKEHIAHIMKKVNSTLYRFRFFRKTTTLELLKS